MMTYKQLQEHINYYNDLIYEEKSKILLAEKEIERQPKSSLFSSINVMRERLERYENRLDLLKEIEFIHYKEEFRK